MNRRTILLYSLASFASLETVLTIIIAVAAPTSGAGAAHIGAGGSSNPLIAYSPPLSIAGWIAVGLVVFQGRVNSRRSQVKSMFARMGFGSDVYDLMVGMRGAGSRVSLLQKMDSPRHKLELSEMTGIDWKEVDRELGVLEKYGLVKMYAQSGVVKLYQETEQGKLLLRLVEELTASTA